MTGKTAKEISLLKKSTVISFIFALGGFFFALKSRSQSVFFDALFSFTAVFFTLISAKVVKLVLKGDDKKYHFGYGAFEPLFIVIRSIFIICMNLTLAANAIKTIIGGGNTISLSYAAFYTILSAIVSLGGGILLHRHARKMDSPTLFAESKSWFNDALLSFSVLFSFALIAVLKYTPLAGISVYMDSIITLFFIVLITPQFVKQLLFNMKELLIAAPSQDTQAELDQVIRPFVEEHGFSGFNIYSSQRGRSLYILIHVYLDKERKIRELDKIRKEMVCAVRKYNSFSDTDIIFTIDTDWIPLSVPSEEETTEK